MAGGGQAGIRGYLVQTLIGLLEALDDKQHWTSVTLEPKVDSEKVDILWRYPDRRKAVQVKSTQNAFGRAEVERWARELEAWKQADEYELRLVGQPASEAVGRIRKIGKVRVPRAMNLDPEAFKERAAHRLDHFLRRYDLPGGNPTYRELLVEALTARLAGYSTEGREVLRADFVGQLQEWVRHEPTPTEDETDSRARLRQGQRGAKHGVRKPADPAAYLRDLCLKSAYIDIRGLVVGKGEARRFPIDDLFISLTTSQPADPRGAGREPGDGKGRSRKAGRRAGKPGAGEGKGLVEHRAVPLHMALRHDRLVVVGDPGAGKTTFLRRVAHALAQTQLGEAPAAARERLGLEDRLFPILVRLCELAQHLVRQGNEASAPTGEAAAAWLPHYLAAEASASKGELDEDFFDEQLAAGSCTVLLDGLDEAPDRVMRERLSRLIENAFRAYPRCRFVITSRPAGYTGEAVLPDCLHARIDPLSDESVETFLTRWCEALYAESPAAAAEHCRELLEALHRRPDIRRMARNPVMLTALAVVHWNERRLPEQRADLYESIIRWLSRSREQRPGRPKADRTVELLRELALAMQNHPEGLRTQVSRRWAAETLAPEWAEGPVDEKAIGRAELFLVDEELDSGIVVGRGPEVQFWHRTFQEYLAARAIAAQPDAKQLALLWGPPRGPVPAHDDHGTEGEHGRRRTPGRRGGVSRGAQGPRHLLYQPEWREVVLLLGGILHGQGREKVDNLVREALARLGTKASLADQARCVGLLGAMFRDLEPVDYEPPQAEYRPLLNRVMAVFDLDRSQNVPIEERIAAADALGQAGDPRLDFGRKDYWATFPAEKFLMGAQKEDPRKSGFDEEAYGDESPVHEVQLDSFTIARYPLTVGQYREFVEDDGYQEPRWWEAGGFGIFSGPERWDEQVAYLSRPVVGVSWYEAAAYCVWAGRRLPTEAEWEFAARGTEGRKYPWGQEQPDSKRTNISESGIDHPTPVGVFPADMTPEVILDLAGNVLEWCVDWYVPYADRSVANPDGPAQAAGRVIRGGSWYDVARRCRAAYRRWFEPESRSDDLGFRVAAVPPGRTGTGNRAGGTRSGGRDGAGGARRLVPERRAGGGAKRRK